jgi:uncharacterized protein YegJ (DUF2314 family)
MKRKPPPQEVLNWVIISLAVSALLLGQIVYKGQLLKDGFVNPWVLGIGLTVLCAAGLWCRQRWAKWLGVALLAGLAVFLIAGLVIGGFSWVRLFATAFCVWAVWDLSRLKMPREGEEDDEPGLSLVLLFREPVYLESAILAEMASHAWDADVEAVVEDEEEDDEEVNAADAGEETKSFVAGQSPHFLCTHWPAIMAVHNLDEPYFEDVDEVAESVPELRARRAIQQHQAWLSVDLLHWFEEGQLDQAHAYRLIGRLLAELADDNCLAVMIPAEGLVFAYDPETEVKLRSEDPQTALCEAYYAPVLTVSEDDPEMQAAVQQARKRWPEFVAAFEKRNEQEESPFLIKAPFSDNEHTEFMWVEVTGIENDVIYGVLENIPANVQTVSEGQVVRVKVADLNDWMCMIDGSPAGAFTLKVLTDRNQDPEP